MSLRFLCGLCVLCAACGSSSPTAPSTPVTPIIPSGYTVSGLVTATNGGQALSGLAVDLNGQSATTNGSGGFSYTLASGSTARLLLSGAGIVPRSLTMAVSAARTIAVGAIALGGGFDLGFYRQFVRNGFEAPTQLQPLRRWTQNPNIYLRTIDDAGTALDTKTLDVTEAAIRETVPLWTAGALTAVVERGAGTKDGVVGWITVHWQSIHNAASSDVTQCGNSLVGANPGTVNFSYAGVCRCPGTEIRPRTVRHEIGHAMGFWHTGNANDLLSGLSVSDCEQFPSARERLHAAIAYARPVGNTDPDSDPTSTVNLAPMTVR